MATQKQSTASRSDSPSMYDTHCFINEKCCRYCILLYIHVQDITPSCYKTTKSRVKNAQQVAFIKYLKLDYQQQDTFCVSKRLLLFKYGTNAARGFRGFCLKINWRISYGPVNVRVYCTVFSHEAVSTDKTVGMGRFTGLYLLFLSYKYFLRVINKFQKERRLKMLKICFRYMKR